MALQGLAQHSRDNNELNDYIHKHADTAVDVFLNKYSVQHIAVLGDVLTTLTNLAVDSSVAEILVAKKVVSRTMRLLDGLEASENPAAVPLKELALILLNNLTASHVTAVDDLLQLQDEDLKGFFLSKLCTIFDRTPVDAPRDVRKWILQIILNITRVPEAQVALLQDDEWVLNVTSLLDTENEAHRVLLVQTIRNCAASKGCHELLAKSGVVPILVGRLARKDETVEGIVMMLAESISGMLQSPEGIEALEGINAKQILQGAIKSNTLHKEIVSYLQEQVIPFLDDIQDAYIKED
ncbi:Hypothetical protein, putative [Bodo saltans]|uniref:Uncharacterized protein n=1 Tax=Bodo saltans TaxID=75058 RepID=A0A0S4J7H7_BODSA|nr:Hypothetical protein, putative [Bodo saltans]|eukprot:CUG86252.1 Hypothetical protein, putative [Bodo saltans]